MLETYPVSSRTYVLGVFLGRAVALVAILGVPLLAAWAYLATTPPETPTSAYRGLVLGTVLQSPGTAVAQAIPLLNVLGLLLVLLGSLVVATVALKRR